MLNKDSEITDPVLIDKVKEVRRKTVEIHGVAPETRVASSLSCVEIFVALYYGGILKYRSKELKWEERDRLVVSKGHGAVSLYPILADLGFFCGSELEKVGKKGSFLGGIPDPVIPGFETINGSLGQGLGVACGMALGLKKKGREENVFIVMGDGELFEGSVWEAVMFAGQHKLDNMVLILDENKLSMLDYCRRVIDMYPLEDKFKMFGWDTVTIDGHNVVKLKEELKRLKEERNNGPKLLIADTVKGKGVAVLENDVLCHVKTLTNAEIDEAMKEL